MEVYFLFLIRGLPPEVTRAIVYFAAHKMPYKRYGKYDFKRCLAACATHVTHFYKIKVTKDYLIVLGEFIRLLGELFESRTRSTIPKWLRLILIGGSVERSLGYEGIREKPPPNLPTQLLNSVAAISC